MDTNDRVVSLPAASIDREVTRRVNAEKHFVLQLPGVNNATIVH
jgi:hypothetical protein